MEIKSENDFIEASKLRDELTHLLNKKRCAVCEHYTEGLCRAFNQDVPIEFVYSVTECEEFSHDIPF